VLLSSFFCVTYTFANFVTARRADVPSIVFAWERRIPFLPWSIVPYWSIDVFYGVSVFVCKTRDELDVLVRRLLTAQMVAVTCFLLFRALSAIDRPFNQAPSLHIALLVVLWRLYGRHLRGIARTLLHVWFALIGLSVLTTYQHHVIDVPAGALLGLFSIWLWPETSGLQTLVQISDGGATATNRKTAEIPRQSASQRVPMGGELVAPPPVAHCAPVHTQN